MQDEAKAELHLRLNAARPLLCFMATVPSPRLQLKRHSLLCAGAAELSEPSEWWWGLRTGPAGDELLRDLLRQALLALQALHSHNITHRWDPGCAASSVRGNNSLAVTSKSASSKYLLSLSDLKRTEAFFGMF